MPEQDHKFWKTPSVVIAAAILVVQAIVFYTLSHGDAIPLRRPLAQFPSHLGSWTLVQDVPIDADSKEILGADDYLMRLYENRGAGRVASLYVAYWQTQQTGQTPHSPKNCLPGNGWAPSIAGAVNVSIPGLAEPIQVNRYVIVKGNEKALVLYWYQSHSRVVASEYSAKVYTVLDSLRYHRSDTALVRVFAGIPEGDEDAAQKSVEEFVRAFYGSLRSFLPV